MAKPKPPEPVKTISLYAPESVQKRLKELAAESGMSVSAYCVKVLEEAAERGVSVETEFRLTDKTESD